MLFWLNTMGNENETAVSLKINPLRFYSVLVQWDANKKSKEITATQVLLYLRLRIFSFKSLFPKLLSFMYPMHSF